MGSASIEGGASGILNIKEPGGQTRELSAQRKFPSLARRGSFMLRIPLLERELEPVAEFFPLKKLPLGSATGKDFVFM